VRGENDDQYEKIINQGLNTIGNKIWLPATTASGKITAQSTRGDRPPWGHKVGREHNDHHEYDERQPETAQGAWDLDEEVEPFDLFLRRAPRDVVREEVREEVADLQEWDPDNVLVLWSRCCCSPFVIELPSSQAQVTSAIPFSSTADSVNDASSPLSSRTCLRSH
jgi:hypothetical protein